MTACRSRTSHRPLRRQRERGLVVTEGTKTEVEYLQRLRQALPRSAPSFEIVGVGADPVRVVREARKRLQRGGQQGAPFDWCFCLIDVDQHSGLQEAIKLAADHGIQVLVSNPCFEIWLAWHLTDLTRHVDSQELATELDKRGARSGKSLTRKFPVEQFQRARARAVQSDHDLASNRIGPNPSSALPVLLATLTAVRPNTG